MRVRSDFSARRIPLPSRVQIQTERERLRRSEQRSGVLLRWIAAGIALFILFSTVIAICFPVLRVKDDVLMPLLRKGDYVLIVRSVRADDGQLCAYTMDGQAFLRRQMDAEDMVDAGELLGRVLLRFGKDRMPQLVF